MLLPPHAHTASRAARCPISSQAAPRSSLLGQLLQRGHQMEGGPAGGRDSPNKWPPVSCPAAPQTPRPIPSSRNPSHPHFHPGVCTWTHLKNRFNELPPLHDLTIATDNPGLLQDLFTTHLILACAKPNKLGKVSASPLSMAQLVFTNYM